MDATCVAMTCQQIKILVEFDLTAGASREDMDTANVTHREPEPATKGLADPSTMAIEGSVEETAAAAEEDRAAATSGPSEEQTSSERPAEVS